MFFVITYNHVRYIIVYPISISLYILFDISKYVFIRIIPPSFPQLRRSHVRNVQQWLLSIQWGVSRMQRSAKCEGLHLVFFGIVTFSFALLQFSIYPPFVSGFFFFCFKHFHSFLFFFFFSSPFSAGVMGCGATEATCLGFVCFVFINPRVLSSANRVDFGLIIISSSIIHIIYSPPPVNALLGRHYRLRGAVHHLQHVVPI